MIFTQIRHASCILALKGGRFLVDPILYKKNSLEPISGGINEKNPLVDIVVGDELLRNIDAILLTHVHMDHFDSSILDFFGKDVPIVCSHQYEKQLTKAGFRNLHLLKDKITIYDTEITLTSGKHGTGVVGKLMGNTYGFVLKESEGDTVYVTGDTVWCKCVESAIETYSPNYIIAFAGSAMINGTHITMDEHDIANVLAKLPSARVIAIHMEAWNHCRLTRSALKAAVDTEQLSIPADGETLDFS